MPTRKQKKAVKILLENPGISTSEVMRQAGYSDASIVDGQKNLLQTKGFRELMEEYLPDERLAQVHSEGLSAVKTTRDKFGDRYEDPDYYVRHSYLETAYRIKGRLNPTNSDNVQPITVNLVLYGKQDNNNTVPIRAERLPNAVPGSDGRRIQESSDSVA